MEAAGLVRLGQSRLVFHVPHSMSGFIQPALLLDLLPKEDVDGFSDNCLTVLQILIQCMTRTGSTHGAQSKHNHTGRLVVYSAELHISTHTRAETSCQTEEYDHSVDIAADFEVEPQPPRTTVLLNTYPFYQLSTNFHTCAITQSYQ